MTKNDDPVLFLSHIILLTLMDSGTVHEAFATPPYLQSEEQLQIIQLASNLEHSCSEGHRAGLIWFSLMEHNEDTNCGSTLSEISQNQIMLWPFAKYDQ